MEVIFKKLFLSQRPAVECCLLLFVLRITQTVEPVNRVQCIEGSMYLCMYEGTYCCDSEGK